LNAPLRAATSRRGGAFLHQDLVFAFGYADLAGLALSLGLGLLIGIQRGWAARGQPAGSRFAGIRTYGLFGLAGGIAGMAAAPAPVLSAMILFGAAALVVEGYWRAGQASGTASLVTLLTIACGYLAGGANPAAAAFACGSVVLVLAMRRPLHQLVASLDEREVMAIGRFALIALVVLPLLPDTPLGPMGAWKPRSLWLIVVLVSGFSFCGYLAAKWLGPARGILATAASGALVSSTAVTTAMAGKMRAADGDVRVLNAAVALASAIMFVRVMVLTAALAPFALPTLATGAVPGMVVSLIGAGLIWRGGRSAAAEVAAPDLGADAGANAAGVPLRNPFDLGPALLMTALVMVLTLAARWVMGRYGDHGLAVVLAITGTVDVDSAIITMGSLPAGALSARSAGLVLLPPILLNTLLKAGIARSLGGRRAWPAAMTLLASIVAGLLPVLI
jgi:uncharacterized membrane protein (DUF4010 family)